MIQNMKDSEQKERKEDQKTKTYRYYQKTEKLIVFGNWEPIQVVLPYLAIRIGASWVN